MKNSKPLNVGLIFICLLPCSCSDGKPTKEQSAVSDMNKMRSLRESMPVTPPQTKYKVRTTTEDWDRVKEVTEALASGDPERISSAMEVLRRNQTGRNQQIKEIVWPREELVLFLVNTVMADGTLEERQLVDRLVSALTILAQSKDEDQSSKAYRLIVGMTQAAFEAARASGPGSIPPEKNVEQWWKSSRVHQLLSGGK